MGGPENPKRLRRNPQSYRLIVKPPVFYNMLGRTEIAALRTSDLTKEEILLVDGEEVLTAYPTILSTI